MRERHVHLAPAPDVASLIRATKPAICSTIRPGAVVSVDCARYATNFLYNQRRPSWRRQTCPRTSRPVMLRLGMMTRRRCQVVGLAGRRFNASFRMSMAAKLIDGMMPPLAQAAAAGTARSGHPGPLVGFHDRRPCRDREYEK
jgi:hypothetical protein